MLLIGHIYLDKGDKLPVGALVSCLTGLKRESGTGDNLLAWGKAMHRLGAILFATSVVSGSSALASPVVDMRSERVLVNCGSGYHIVTGFTEVRPGCKVMADAETGHGFILYSDCDVEVLPGKVYTVRDDPGPQDVKGFRPICEVAAVPWWLVGAGVAGAAVGITAAAGAFDDDDGPGPASP